MTQDYRVIRAFREPREGGAHVPYRFYEVGVTVTIDDFRAWQLGPAIEQEIPRLVNEGYLVEKIVPHQAAEVAPEPEPAEESDG